MAEGRPMTNAELQAYYAGHGIETELSVDDNGDEQVVITTEEGLRKMADISPDPTRAHAMVDQLLAAADDGDVSGSTVLTDRPTPG
ncbi:hypothetical protein ACIPH4_10975 [Streptomyces tendae]|uniref:hypothetical protein n=1 Tax=Streptomyces tendae TaxID=1932 RepID=UPI00380E0F98